MLNTGNVLSLHAHRTAGLRAFTSNILFNNVKTNTLFLNSYIETRKQQLTELIKAEASRLGFAACGISKADYLSEDAEHLKNYLDNKRQGKMAYLENHFDKRLDPRLLVAGAKSVVSVLFNYYTDKKQTAPEVPIIAKYAYGKDYHYVLKEKLNKLFDSIKGQDENVTGRVFVDSAPVMERVWARKSGLGWIGKNGLLINKKIGSFVFIGELIIDIELEYDKPIGEYCGTCTKCIDACPTKAIIADKQVDGSKCISYLTIEMRGDIPEEFTGNLQDRVFGCDICQDVCPHNSKAKPHAHEELKPLQGLLEMNKADWYSMDKATFNQLFKYSPIKRTRYTGIKRNLVFIAENKSSLNNR